MLAGLLSFGQPVGGLIQIAYTVPDLKPAMADYSRLLSAGPWFVLRDFAGIDPIYRGAPSTALCDIALGFVGHIQIELVQPQDDRPSVYKEAIERAGFGFHHFGVATADMAAARKDHLARGYEEAFSARTPDGGSVIHFDTMGAMSGMIELIHAGEGLNAMFGAMHEASVNWDGSDPVRSFG